MAGKLVAEDVPIILSRKEAGEPVRVLASSYNVSVGTIYNVLHGWVPPTRAEIEDLAERKRLAQERGLKSYVRKPYETLPRRARTILTKAIDTGAIVRQPCFCGETKVEGHHHKGYAPGYELDVVWLCQAHHKMAHVQMRRASQKVAGITSPDATPVVDTSDTSTARRSFEDVIAAKGAPPKGSPERVEGVARVEAELAAIDRVAARAKPSFLAAPDDDCASCGHDRQTYHLNADGKCWAPAPHKRSRRCECPAFLDPSEPF